MKNSSECTLLRLLAAIVPALIPSLLWAHDGEFEVLVFSKTVGYRHSSISDGITAIQRLGKENNFHVDTTEDSGNFTPETLAKYSCVVFLNSTGNILDSMQQLAFEEYIRKGGGYVGIHAASDCEYEWPWYRGLVGAYFRNHPAIQQAEIIVEDRTHPSTSHLPSRWKRTDEWYMFDSIPRGKVHVLASVDERTYSGGGMGHDHPIAWCHRYDGGKAWYTAGGHTSESFYESDFTQHILGGILWAAGKIPGDADAGVTMSYEREVLVENLEQPIAMQILTNGDIIFCLRRGNVRKWSSSTGKVLEMGRIPCYFSGEYGLLGLALAPDFPISGLLYVSYSAATDSVQRLSRFRCNDTSLLLATEQIILQVHQDRSVCCHVGGDIEFSPDSTLYFSTGDNTNPFIYNNYAPIDERKGHEIEDAQRTSANTNDLRGKILRIRPLAGGGYAIPSGNLFVNTPGTRPEIYAMGVRNPFRIAADPKDGRLYWGDVGPDGFGTDSLKTPTGHDELNVAPQPGNFGWPYFTGNNFAYRKLNFDTKEYGTHFNPNAPENTSPNNTGLKALPPATPPFVWYPYYYSSDFPEFGIGGRSIIAGSVFRFDSVRPSKFSFPKMYDGALFIGEFIRRWVKICLFDENKNLLRINHFRLNDDSAATVDMRFDNNGMLYVIEWPNTLQIKEDARIVRYRYTANAAFLPPKAKFTTSASYGNVPLSVECNGNLSTGAGLRYSWKFSDDTVRVDTTSTTRRSFDKIGTYTVTLTVSDRFDQQSSVSAEIIAGNTPPVVRIIHPRYGSFAHFGDSLKYTVEITDAEDSAISDSECWVSAGLGHDQHSHPLIEQQGRKGIIIPKISDSSHSNDANLFLVFGAKYRDAGNKDAKPLQSTAMSIVHPYRIQAEHFSSSEGIGTEKTSDEQGGTLNIASIDDGESAMYNGFDLSGITAIEFRYASAYAQPTIEIRLDSANGTLIGRAENLPVTGGYQSWKSVRTPIIPTNELHNLCLVFRYGVGATGILNVNWLEFIPSSTTSVMEASLHCSDLRCFWRDDGTLSVAGLPEQILRSPVVSITDILGRYVSETEVRMTGDNTLNIRPKSGFILPGVYALHIRGANNTNIRCIIANP